jgi:3-hydroxyisobutyrate dehydrogenase
MDEKQSVALLGLGTMGRSMAANLLKAGFPLTIWNRTWAKAESLTAQGAAVAESPAAAAKKASVVISMVSDDNASRSVWLGRDGALAAMPAGAIAVECSTLSPAWISELHTTVTDRKLRMVEAPVTGSRPQAEAGQLNFLVGAEKETLIAITPVLRCMSKELLHLGPVGTGAQMKLVNNFLCAVQIASFAEALGWIERTQLQREAALDFLKRGAPGSGILSTMSERMTQRTYDVNFLLRLMAKDLRYAHAAAAQLGVNLSTSSPAEELFRKAQDRGDGEKDVSAVVEVVRNSERHSRSSTP